MPTRRKRRRDILTDADDRLVSGREILDRFLPVHRSTLARMVQDGRFPPPVRLGGALFWKWSVVRAWLDAIGQDDGDGGPG